MSTRDPITALSLESKYSELAASIFEEIKVLSDDGIGVSRQSYGEFETAAINYLIGRTQNYPFEHFFDPAGNLIIEYAGEVPSAPYILIGSHMDAVPNGGNYDGLAGVVAGLIVLIYLSDKGIKLKNRIRVVGLRGEESAWFGPCYIGSRSLVGKFPATYLESKRRDTGRPLEEYMRELGCDVDGIKEGKIFVSKEDAVAFLEVHIEQGPVLVKRNIPISVVTGIRGNFRYQSITCVGEAGHSGAVPRWLRHDSVFAVSDLIHRIDEHWKTIEELGGDLVITVGIIGTHDDEHAMSRIPGRVDFSCEARSQNQSTLDNVERLIIKECKEVEKERGVKFEFGKRMTTEPAVMDQNIIQQMKSIADANEIPCELIASGAGHDASVFANAGIPSGMIFVRNENGSHNPDEAMEIEDFMLGLDLLAKFLVEEFHGDSSAR